MGNELPIEVLSRSRMIRELRGRIGVARMDSPSVMEAHLALLKVMGTMRIYLSVRTELLFHLTQILMVEKPHALQAPAIGGSPPLPRADCE